MATRSSRRSSAIREVENSDEILLGVFENIDDPDAYYGLTQDASLSTVLARLEYENDGAKSLAFRGAKYDSNLRCRDPESGRDGRALIKALSDVGLSGLSNSLLQTQQSLGGSSTTQDGTFTTARRLEMWNLPVPSNNQNWSATVYKAYQSLHQASDIQSVRDVVRDGLSSTVRHLTNRNLNASSMRLQLGALAALTELDDMVNVADIQELRGLLGIFEQRSGSDLSSVSPCY